MIYKLFLSSILVIFLFGSNAIKILTPKSDAYKSIASVVEPKFEANIEVVYQALDANEFELPTKESFAKALMAALQAAKRGPTLNPI